MFESFTFSCSFKRIGLLAIGAIALTGGIIDLRKYGDEEFDDPLKYLELTIGILNVIIGAGFWVYAALEPTTATETEVSALRGRVDQYDTRLEALERGEQRGTLFAHAPTNVVNTREPNLQQPPIETTSLLHGPEIQ